MGPKFLWNLERNFPLESVSTEINEDDMEVKKIFVTEVTPLK